MIIAIILVVILLVSASIAFFVSISSGGIAPTSGGSPWTIGLASTGGGYRSLPLPTAAGATWGAGLLCSASSPCQTDNFSMSASSGITTGSFGFKITTKTGSTVTGWIIVLWNATGNLPLSAWSQSNGNWSAAHGQTLPIGGLQDDGVMLITAPGTTLVGSGDTLSSFGTGSRTVSGSTTL